MLENYTFKNYIIESQPQDFFNWCLENTLYKKSKSKYFNSRMKAFYEQQIDFKGLTCVLAFYKKNPVGIILCEHQDYFEHARVHEDLSRFRLKVTEEFDWGMQQVGMLSMYIKKSHRKKGLAKNMLIQLEKLRLSQIAKEDFEFNPLSVPLFQARELAFDIVLKYSQYSYVTQYFPCEYLYPHNIDNITRSLLNYRANPNSGVELLRIRNIFNQLEFKNLNLNYETIFNYENLEKELVQQNKNKKMRI